HTISKRDWSSDVCSSDLDIEKLFGADDTGVKQINETLPAREESSVLEEYVHLIYWGMGILILMVVIILAMRYFGTALSPSHNKRSEERRVGKESSCRTSE